VDDSAFARKVVREVLEANARVEVVGIARDGLEALEQIATLAPDVITLDLVMPNLDGVGLLRALAELQNAPKVILVSMSDGDSELVLEALELGAIDLVRKPTALATDRLYELGDELVGKVLAAAGARVVSHEPALAPKPSMTRSRSTELVVIGTSTGGPQALTQLLPALPHDFPVPIVIALHIPVEYTAALAARLNQLSSLSVVEGMDGVAGVELLPGMVVLAKGGVHVRVDREGDKLFARTTREAASAPYTPSVDLLLTSAAAACGKKTLAVVLTGMGDDGLIGARAVYEAGGRILTEAEPSCVVYGMPRCIEEANLSLASVPLSRMAAELVERV
jgi:two-component system chemotaxis response regulator CheB